MSLQDFLLELRISAEKRLMLWHESGRNRAAQRFASLIRLRSPARVRQMEEERGFL